MSRRKQAKPRALKRDDGWDSEDEKTADPVNGASPADDDDTSPVNGDDVEEADAEEKAPGASGHPLHQAPRYDVTLEGFQMALLDRRNLQCLSDAFLGECGDAMRASSRRPSPTPTASHVTQGDGENSLESVALGTDPGSSWRSDTPEDQTSPSPSSCATPNSATDVPDADLTFTVGVTEGTPYACQFCDKAFPRLSYLKKHEQTHSDQMPFRCEFCSRLFKHKRSRDRHIKLHTGDKKYRCTHCEAAFSRSDHLKIHMKTHDNQKPFQCTVCNRGYNTAAALTSHMQNHKKDQHHAHNGHNTSNSSRASSNNTPSPGAAATTSFRCLQCGDVFRKPEELQGHMFTHHHMDMSGSPPGAGALARGLLGGLMLADMPLIRSPMSFPAPKLACIYCTKDSFTTMEALQLHVQAMHGSILNGDMREFSSLSHRHRHQASPSPNVHPQHHLSSPNGPGPGAGNNHTVTTSSLMPYSCELCTMRFGTLQGMQKHAIGVHGMVSPPAHIKDHHNEHSNRSSPGLFCIQCSMSFPSPTLFADHYVLMHGSLNGASMLNSSPPSAEQLKPTDLSKKSHRHSKHSEERQAKRQKVAAENALLSSNADSTTPSSLMNQYDHPGTLLCNQCSAALPDFESFRNHLKAHLEEAGGLRGLLGGAGGGMDLMGMLGSVDRPQSHVQAKSPVTSSNTVSCPHCGAKFSGSGGGDEQQAFEQHVASHFMATATEYGCQSCLKLFAKPDELQKHLMDIHAHHLYRCSLCKEMFDSKVAIQVHFAVKHSNECKLFRCTACVASNAVYRTEAEFGGHVRSAHAPLQHMSSPAGGKTHPQHRCLFCHLSFASELEMQFHLAAHSKQYHCHLCQEGFHVEFLLDKHMQTHHSNGANLPDSAPQKSPKSKSNGSVSAISSSNNGPASGNHAGNEAGKKGGVDQGVGTTCDICDRCDFGSEAELLSHRKLVHHVKPSTGKNGAVSLHCAYCSENCKSRTELENHMKTHSQGSGVSGKHKCNICDELCPSAAVLAEHKLTHCKVIAGSTCTQCKATMINEDQFFTHLQQHSTNNNNTQGNNQQQVLLPTPCVVCRQTLISDIEVRMHARFHLKNSAIPEPLFQCCLCLKQFDVHKLIMTGSGGGNGLAPSLQSPSYVCKDCYHMHHKTSPSQQHQDDAHRCAECQVKFESTSALEAHLVAVHRKTYQCIKCQVSFETEREIQLHVATHMLTDGGGTHECHLCRRHLSTPLKLQAHLIEHTFAGCGSFTCYLCSAVFTAAQGLQQHMLEHGLSARPYDCSRCSLRFFFRAELDNHSFAHLDEDAANVMAASYHHLNNNSPFDMGSEGMHYYKTAESPKQKSKSKSPNGKGSPMFKCLECNKELSSALGLQAHQRYHKHSSSGKKSHACIECGKEFALARNLSVHMRSHHGEHMDVDDIAEDANASHDEQMNGSKLGHLSCPVCGRDFADLDQLESHVSSQHVRCPHCRELFSRQSYVEEHIRKVHDAELSAMKQEPVEIKEERVQEEDIDVLSPSGDRLASETTPNSSVRQDDEVNGSSSSLQGSGPSSPSNTESSPR